VTEKEYNQSQIHPSEDQISPGFQRRYYRGWRSFWKELKFILSHQDKIKSAMNSEILTAAFRERLMLAVTEVNQCSYCRKFHVGQAKNVGISVAEITQYLKGTIPETIPEEQKLAVCYAQHWAENDAKPDPDFQDQVRRVYGEQGLEEISMVLRMIRMGNLLGNTADYLLYKISLGKWGG
jgi:AhpD family alkylhydroperoxidase